MQRQGQYIQQQQQHYPTEIAPNRYEQQYQQYNQHSPHNQSQNLPSIPPPQYQQYQQPQQYPNSIPAPNQYLNANYQPVPYPQHPQQQPQQQTTPPVNTKISIQRAITLITIRLGELESHVQQLQQAHSANFSHISENNTDSYSSLVKSIEELENKVMLLATPSLEKDEEVLTTTDTDIETETATETENV